MTRTSEVQAKNAVILAAGRGSRLVGQTDDKPKCLTVLREHTLLDLHIAALQAAGIERITVVGGYRVEQLARPDVDVVTNEQWASTNMVASLLVASDVLREPTIVSYSDIVYNPADVQALANCDQPIAIAYDPAWQLLWQRRFVEPLTDAESFTIDANGRVIDIGRPNVTFDEIHGQYMGLLRIDAHGHDWIEQHMRTLDRHVADHLSMTELLRQLIASGRAIHGVAINHLWCEIDDDSDLDVAHDLVDEGLLSWLSADASGVARNRAVAE